jgi:DNA-binding NtrC family response regulator
LIVDDEPSSIQAVANQLRRKGYDVTMAETGAAASAVIRDEPIGLTILDLGLRGGEDGLDLLPRLKALRPMMSVIIFTGRGRTAEDAFASGQRCADRYVEKTIAPEKFLMFVAEALQAYQRRRLELEQLAKGSNLIYHPDGPMNHALSLAVSVAGQETTVLLQGETGTGKQLVAQLIHEASPRKHEPFREVNCAGLQPDLVDSTLFCHEKGAFTGAVAERISLFEEANGGTLFLDEIAGMGMDVQAKLLKVLDQKRIRRLGGRKDIQVDARLIAATNQDLAEEVDRGRFRRDLFFRLKVFTINIPPLRNRREDILLLAQHFLRQFYRGQPPVLSEETAAILLNYDWPGNVRELKNAIERVATVCPVNSEVLPSHLPPLDDKVATNFGLSNQNSTQAHRSSAAKTMIETIERQELETALTANHWNMTATAKTLGMSRDTLYRKMHKYHLSREK